MISLQPQVEGFTAIMWALLLLSVQCTTVDQSVLSKVQSMMPDLVFLQLIKYQLNNAVMPYGHTNIWAVL